MPLDLADRLSVWCTEDEQFKEEKAVIIKEISVLQPPSRRSTAQ